MVPRGLGGRRAVLVSRDVEGGAAIGSAWQVAAQNAAGRNGRPALASRRCGSPGPTSRQTLPRRPGAASRRTCYRRSVGEERASVVRARPGCPEARGDADNDQARVGIRGPEPLTTNCFLPIGVISRLRSLLSIRTRPSIRWGVRRSR